MVHPDPSSDRDRRRLFRRMELLYVWGPIGALVLVAAGGGAIVAWLLPLPWPFLTRWLAVVGLVLLVALVGWFVQRPARRPPSRNGPDR
jgi:hypothetical protein